LAFLVGQVIAVGFMWAQITQVIGFCIVVFSHRAMIEAVEKDMRDREASQIICMIKSKFEPTKPLEAQKIENQLSYIYDSLGETMFRQAIQDILLNK
jgi:hypothetical protein